MAEERVSKVDMQTIWVQPEGPNAPVYRMGCYQIDSAEKPHGDFDQIICQDPQHPGKYKRIALTRSVPGLPTATMNGFKGAVADYMEQVARRDCPFSVYVTNTECSPKNTFLNYEWALVLEYAGLTSESISPLATRDTQDATMVEFPLTMLDIQTAYDLTLSERTTGETDDARDLVTLGDQCQGICGPNVDPCDYLYVVFDSDGIGGTAPVRYSTDGGATLTATSAAPFAADENICSIVAFVMDSTYVRLVVARGTTDAGNPAEIAYADVAIATAPQTTAWTAVNVGATNGEFGNHSGSLFALDRYHIWFATDQGEIYFSNDAGATWTAQGAAAGDELNYVMFANERNGIAVGGSTGASHVILTTTNGGTNWNAVTMTGPGATVMAWCGYAFDSQRMWVGFEGGQLYYTLDAGANWTARALPLGPAASLTDLMDITWVDDYFGFLAIEGVGSGNTRYAMVLKTFNGGESWEVSYVQGADAGTELLKAIIACHHNRALACGGLDDAGAAMVLDLHE